MKIFGLQKLTLLDYPGKVAATVFTGGCNFCCPFCHNASLVTHIDPHLVIEEQEFFGFLAKRQGILDGICVSGGEPLLQPDIVEFITHIKDMGYLVKLDSNGSFPDMLRSLVESKLVDYVAMDIKNSKEKYALTCGKEDIPLDKVVESAAFLMENHVPYEFRTTVVQELHTKEDFVAIGQWLSPTSPYYLQGFVDSGDLIEERFSAYSKEEMEEFITVLRQTMEHVELRGV